MSRGLASVTPEANLRNSLYAGNKPCKQRIHPDFESQDRHHQNRSINGPKKGCVLLLNWSVQESWKLTVIQKR